MENQMNRSNLVNFFHVLNDDMKFETFCYAVLQNNKEMCQILLDSGFDINSCSKREIEFCNVKHYETVLTLFTRKGKESVVEMAKWLIEHGADTNGNINCDSSPLLLACNANNYELVKLYLEHGAKVTKKTIVSAMQSHIEIDILKEQLKAIKGKHYDISWYDIYDSIDYNRRTFEKVKLLFQFGMEPTYKEIFNCLQALVEEREIEGVKYLLENYLESVFINDKISSYDRENKHAIVYLCDIAVQNEDMDMLKLLKSYGGKESTTKEKTKKILRELRNLSKHDNATRTELENELLVLLTKK